MSVHQLRVTRVHPAFTAADVARMSVSELGYFTDAPVAHAVAYEDFQRQARIEARNADMAREVARRQRELTLARLNVLYGAN